MNHAINDDDLNRESKKSKFSVGIKFGIIAGLLYMVLLLIRYMFFSGNPMVFTATMFISYLIIVSLFAQAAFARKKQLGGFADIKTLFGTIFIVILFAEVCYAFFNYFYLNVIDPTFFDRYLESTMNYLKNMGGNEDVLNQQIDKVQGQMEQSGSLTYNLLGIGTWVVVDSIIGIILALVIKKDKPAF